MYSNQGNPAGKKLEFVIVKVKVNTIALIRALDWPFYKKENEAYPLMVADDHL